MRQLYLLLLFLAFLPCSSFAGVLKGKITDSKGEAVPFAIVYIEGTTMGTSAGPNGDYQLALIPGTHKVLCQLMGYRQNSYLVTIKGDETITHDYILDEQGLQMKAIVVKANAEDPAYAIMRKAIARRQFHQDQVRSFQSSIYLKGALRTTKTPKKILGEKIDQNELGVDSTGKGIIYLCEEQVDYYSKGDRERTIIRAVRESGNPGGLGLDQLPPVASFYENNVDPIRGLSPRGFVSPVSDNALHYYNYKYEGEFTEGNYLINKIRVTPKRKYEPLYAGTIYIVENDWAIHSLELQVTAKEGLRILDTMVIQQVFLPLKKDTWVIKNQVLYPSYNLLGFKGGGYFVTVYDKQKVNEPIPDTIFNKKVESSYEKDANKKDTSYWTQNRPIALDNDESKDFVQKDSLRKVLDDPKYKDSMRREGNKLTLNTLFFGINYAASEYKNRFTTNGLVSGLVNYNTVEGLNVAPHLNWWHRIDTGKTLRTTLSPRYGFANGHFNMRGKVMYRQMQKNWRGRWWGIGIEGGQYVYQYNSQSALLPIINTVVTLVQGNNYMKLYERRNAALSFDRDYGNGLQLKAKLDYQQRLPLTNNTTYSWASDAEMTLTPNYPVELALVKWEPHNAALVKASVSYQPGFTYTQYPDYKTSQGSSLPVFSLEYEKGIAGIAGSKSDFDKWRFGISDNMSMKLLGSLSYKIAAGGFLNANYVSLPDLMHLTDNQVILAAPYLKSFQLAPYYRYSNVADIYGELHLEYSLRGLLTNKIPLLRQANWYFLAGTNTFYAGQTNYYTEAFVGVDNLGWKMYRLLRVDFVQSWDNLGRSMTGIRLGLNFLGGSVKISTGDDD
jgi:hypothetical protein